MKYRKLDIKGYREKWYFGWRKNASFLRCPLVTIVVSRRFCMIVTGKNDATMHHTGGTTDCSAAEFKQAFKKALKFIRKMGEPE